MQLKYILMFIAFTSIPLTSCSNTAPTLQLNASTIPINSKSPVAQYEKDGYLVRIDAIEKAEAFSEYKAKKGSKIYILSITIANNTDEEEEIDTEKEMHLRTDKGLYSVLPIKDGTSSLDIEMEHNSINKGKVVFEVPEDEK